MVVAVGWEDQSHHSFCRRLTIEALTRKGRHAERTVQRGRMLLRLADGGSGYTVADE